MDFVLITTINFQIHFSIHAINRSLAAVAGAQINGQTAKQHNIPFPLCAKFVVPHQPGQKKSLHIYFSLP